MDGLQELAKVIDGKGTRREFAELAHLSESYLSDILSGKRPFNRVPVSTAMRISELSGISIEKLAGKSNKPKAIVLQRKRAGAR